MISRYNVAMQWVLGYTGIVGNAAVDKLVDYSMKSG